MIFSELFYLISDQENMQTIIFMKCVDLGKCVLKRFWEEFSKD